MSAGASPSSAHEVHVVLPPGVDDPERPSGGNAYDQRVCRGLAQCGWWVREHLAPGSWPSADDRSLELLDRHLLGLPDGATVLLDGLVASAVPEVVGAAAERLRLVMLLHAPLGQLRSREPADRVAAREAAALVHAHTVVVTSGWTRRWLTERYGIGPERVRVASPGVDAAPRAVASGSGGRLLCVGAVTPTKGQDMLVEALRMVEDLPWTCVVAGSCDVDPLFSQDVLERARRSGLSDRVRFVGALRPDALAREYAQADAVVLASRSETYGMVVTEALARGLPVLAPAVGGVREALGTVAGGGAPGILVRPGSPAALAEALREWLGSAATRAELRRTARRRRAHLHGWSETVAVVADVLEGAGR